MSSETFAERRQAMVKFHIAARGIVDQGVLQAMRTVPREAFVPPTMAEFAYDDIPLSIGEGQTISQPYMVAMMTEALQLSATDRVLEIGTGSGYAAAVLSCLVKQVYTVERLEPLYRLARCRLRHLGYHNVCVHQGNGTLGWPEHAPYDAIVVTAGGPDVPLALQEQLAVGGRLVIPVGPHPRAQRLVRVRRTSASAFQRDELGYVRFVPLVGAQGWQGHELDPSTGEESGAQNVL
jgi:protein-L-isoaspartate(D-aspartate) O-methyltransferase